MIVDVSSCRVDVGVLFFFRVQLLRDLHHPPFTHSFLSLLRLAITFPHVCSQFGNRAVLAKFTTKMDDTRQKRLEEMLSEAQATVSGAGEMIYIFF